jgi:hypothetical protein
MILILKGKNFALTTDAWTSIAKTGYVTCTVHFIDRDTWVLHSMVLGLFEKTGRSRAIDCVEYAERQMVLYSLNYSSMTAVVNQFMITCLRKLIIITCLSSSITMKMLEETMMIITMQRWWRDSIRNI